MKRTTRSKPRPFIKAGKEVDNASAGGLYVDPFVRATVGKLKRNKRGEWVRPTGHGIEVYLRQWGKTGSPRAYMSIEVQSGSAHGHGVFEGTISGRQLDSMIELLTAARDKARVVGLLKTR